MNQYLRYYLGVFLLFGVITSVSANNGNLIIYTNSDVIYNIYRNDHPNPPDPLNYNVLIKSDTSGALLDIYDISLFVQPGYEVKLEGNVYLHSRSSHSNIGSKGDGKGESLRRYFEASIAKKVENQITILSKEPVQEYIIYDMMGREINRKKIIPTVSVDIFVGDLDSGIYKVKIISENGTTDTQSIIK
ncbi:hypothetical protein UJ101_01338 [Flavobacteriaceae bacterium UJ101]|nr:hypothetical protein UJ101_01338 [Flavobacteriaceae bacterium UJ101]